MFRTLRKTQGNEEKDTGKEKSKGGVRTHHKVTIFPLKILTRSRVKVEKKGVGKGDIKGVKQKESLWVVGVGFHQRS